jgi:hypothetical protein
MDVKVVVGEAKPSSDLASRLAMVYNLLLRRAEEAGTGDKQAPGWRDVGGNLSRDEAASDLNNGIAAPHDLP